MEKAGARWWPITGGVYVVRAVKRVHGMRLDHARPGARSARAAAPLRARSRNRTPPATMHDE